MFRRAFKKGWMDGFNSKNLIYPLGTSFVQSICVCAIHIPRMDRWVLDTNYTLITQ